MIKEILPPSIKELEPLAEAVDTVATHLSNQITNNLIYSRIDHLPEEALDLLAWQFHIEGYELATSLEEKRNLVKNAIELHRYKGTPYAIKRVLETLGIQGRVVEWFEYGGQPYRFKVYVSNTREDTWNRLPELISQYKNVRSHLEALNYVQELQERLYYASLTPHGYYIRLYPEVEAQVQTRTHYTGSGFYCAQSLSINTSQPEARIPQSQFFTGGISAMAVYMEVRNG